MYSICFTIAGVIFSILLFIIYSFKTNFSISENKIYHSIIITTIITGLIEIYSFILVKNNIAVDSSLYLYTLKLLGATIHSCNKLNNGSSTLPIKKSSLPTN